MITVGGIDIGGTKCAVSIGKANDGNVEILAKKKITTPKDPKEAVSAMVGILKELVDDTGVTLNAIGISCGSPLDSQNGIIKEPPNLPGWIDIDIVTPFREAFHVPAAVQNDANACALAEWMWGAGQGYRNMIFLTFGTGLGAGLILNVWLKLDIWDYSRLPGNLWGQVCLKYALLWVVLAGTAIVLFDWMRHWLFQEERPHYRWI